MSGGGGRGTTERRAYIFYHTQKPDCKTLNAADYFVKVDLGTAPPHDAEAGSHGAADHELT